MRLSTVILPIYRRTEGGAVWRRAEELGFHAGYTYDHLSWQEFHDGPWFGAVPTLAAAALTTDRSRIGTLVTSPNFRHPVPLAKDLMTLDDVSEGRLIVGIGSGGTGFDASVLGGVPWSAKERTERFGEFVSLLDRLLTQPTTTSRAPPLRRRRGADDPGLRATAAATLSGGGHRAPGVRPGGGTRPGLGDLRRAGSSRRRPGRRGPRRGRETTEELGEACRSAGRDPGTVDRVLLGGLTVEDPLASVDAFVDWAGAYAALGFDEVVVHWPVPDSRFAADPDRFERIVTEGGAQLR